MSTPICIPVPFPRRIVITARGVWASGRLCCVLYLVVKHGKPAPRKWTSFILPGFSEKAKPSREEDKNMAEQLAPTLHILEGGFRPRPEKLTEYGKRHEEFLPIATTQPGFRETYGGLIPGGTWGFFVAKFDSLEDMERWQTHRAHREVQDLARQKWWTGYYIRKGRLLADDKTASGQVLCETAILRNSSFSQGDYQQAETILAQLAAFAVMPYETLRGERILMPYLLSGPVGIVPQAAPVQYVILTYWRSSTDCRNWQDSIAYRQLDALGTVRSSLFVIIPERQARMGLRTDRMQREWMAKE
jgi:heme-degrading monooxygenase HmoA